MSYQYTELLTVTQSFWVHTMILKQRWKTIFKDIMSNKSTAMETNIPSEIMQAILFFVYTGEICLNQFKLTELFDMLRFLTLFWIKSLPKKIIEFLLITKRIVPL